MSETPLLLCSRIPSSTPVTDLAVADLGGGPLVVCADFNGEVWSWDPIRDDWRKRPLTYAFTGDPLAAEYPDAENEVDTVAVAVVDGRVVLAAGDDEQAPALWDLESGRLLRGTTYDAPYSGAITAVRGEGPPRFVTGSQYVGLLEVWDASGRSAPAELPSEQYDITCLASAWIDGRSLLAVGGDGLDVWDLGRGEQLGSFSADDDGIRAAAVDRLRGRRPVVTAATEQALYVWELPEGEWDEDAEPTVDPVTGHEGRIRAMDTVAVGDRLLAVTGADDRTVRVWDLAEGAAAGGPLTGHGGSVETVLTTALHGRPVALSSGRDGTIRVWDLAAAIR